MRGQERDLELELEDDDSTDEEDELAQVGAFQALLQDRRKLFGGMALFVLIIVAIYVVFPKLVGLDDAMRKLDEATWYWIVLAIGFNVAAFGAYVALFRGVLGGTRDDDVHRRLDLRASYLITMAGLAATRIFSAAGAGGIVLTYWALRKAGMPRRRSACRMVAFLVLTYGVYTVALVSFGILLRTHVLPGDAPFGGTVVPAIVAAIAIGVFLLIALIPDDVERRIQSFAGGYRRTRYLTRVAKGPATVASGVRTAIDFVRNPNRGALAVGGAVGFWAANIAVLWACFEAFGGDVPVRGARAGLLRGHGGEPDPLARRRSGIGGRGHDRRIRAVRDRRIDRVPGGAGVPRDRLLAADPAGYRGLLPAAHDGGAVGAGAPGRRRGGTLYFTK